MRAAVQAEVLDDVPDLVALSVVVDDGLHESLDEHPDLTALLRLPDLPRDREHDGLAGEHEGDPHVVLVVHLLLALAEVGLGGDARVYVVLASLSSPPMMYRLVLFYSRLLEE